MLIEMFRTKTDKKMITKYVVSHVIYGALGILLFVPCLKHLFFSDRGLTNLGNSGYFAHIFDYLKHLAYAFSINNSNTALMVSILILFAIACGKILPVPAILKIIRYLINKYLIQCNY